MPLDPDALATLNKMAQAGHKPINELSIEEARKASLLLAAMQGPAEQVAYIENRVVEAHGTSIPIRIYTPFGNGPFPVLMYFHGGGWVIGDIESSDGLCRTLVNAAGCILISVDYRLAPEHPFPAAAQDAYQATLWAASNASCFNGDPSRLAVCGDSAGGNLAAVVALMARDLGKPAICFQLLIYPVTDAACDTLSYQDNAEGYFLTRDAMQWFWNQYVPNEADRNNPYASPLRASDFSRLPRALIITAEFDPLRDEGELYGKKLRDAGVPVEISRYDGMIHGFFGMGGTIRRANGAISQAAGALRSAFGLSVEY